MWLQLIRKDSPRLLPRFINFAVKVEKIADIWALLPVSVMYMEVKNGFKTFFSGIFWRKTHILWFYSTS